MSKCIVLVGVKHSGKTTIGKLLAKRQNLPFFDIDDIIERQNGKTCRELYSIEGCDAFKAAEATACAFFVDAIHDTMDEAHIKGVVAAGGGFCDNPKALESLHDIGLFVYLDVPKHIAFERIIERSKELNSIPATFAHANPQNEEEMQAVFYNQYEKRSEAYSSIADVVVHTEGLTPEQICDAIVKQSTKINF